MTSHLYMKQMDYMQMKDPFVGIMFHIVQNSR